MQLSEAEQWSLRRRAHSDREHDETHELDGLAAPRVDEEEGDPVTRDETGNGENDLGTNFRQNRGMMR
jgi:hypothetical protein